MKERRALLKWPHKKLFQNTKWLAKIKSKSKDITLIFGRQSKPKKYPSLRPPHPAIAVLSVRAEMMLLPFWWDETASGTARSSTAQWWNLPRWSAPHCIMGRTAFGMLARSTRLMLWTILSQGSFKTKKNKPAVQAADAGPLSLTLKLNK